MTGRFSFVDDQKAARGFSTDDIVKKPGNRGIWVSPYSGVVVFSNTKTGVVQVQWPWGVENEQASELINLGKDAALSSLYKEQYDTGYSTYERGVHSDSKEDLKKDEEYRKSISSIINKFEDKTYPVYLAACKAMHDGLDPISAFTRLSKFSQYYGSNAVITTISNLYNKAERIAIYWKDSKRRYRTTRKEKSSGKYSCPRCREMLKPRVYRQGRSVLLCKNCGFTIHPKDLC